MRLFKKILVLMLILLMFSSCTKKQDYSSFVSGKTFYNTVDDYGNVDHSKIWFGKDGSFVIQDNFFDGINEMSGTWKTENNVCTLTVDKTGVGEYKTVKFEIKDEDTIILKTTLAGSKSEDSFSTTEVKGSSQTNTNSNTGSNTNTNQGSTNNSSNQNSGSNSNKTEVTYNTYYSCISNSKLILMSDGSASFIDANELSIMEGNCSYSVSGEYLTLSNFVPNNPFGKDIKFKKQSNSIYVLETDVGISAVGDVFAIDGACPAGSEKIIWENNYHNTVWKHEPINDVNQEYLPTIELFQIQGIGYSFVFTENVYAGMAQFTGVYSADERYLICSIVDNKQLTGFAGQDLQYIEFELINPTTLVLLTDINMSRAGDKFILE